MADKTYTANVDIETKDATKNLDNLNNSTEETAEGFTRLQLRIRETQKALQQAAETGDKTKFNQLKGQLEELEDQLEAVQLGSAKFDDALSALPGPAGAVGNAIKSVDGAFKLLAANPIVAIIGVVAGLFLLLKESLSKTSEGQEVLNRLSEAFGKIIGPIMTIIQKVAIPVFEGFAFVLEKVAEGFGRFAKFLGVAQKDIDEASRNSSESLKKTYEEQQKIEEEAKKKAEENKKKRDEAAKKAEEERKKKLEQERAEAKKRQEEADKILLEAQLAALSDRDRAIKERELKLQDDLLKLKQAGVTDTKLVEENAQKDIQAIKDKFAEEEKKKQEQADADAAKKREEAENKRKEQEKLAFEDRLLGLENQLNQEAVSAQERRDLLAKYEEELLAQEGLTENQRTQIRQDFANQRKTIDEQEIAARRELQSAYIDLVGQFGAFLTQIAGKNKKLAIAGVIVEQAAAIARIIQNTAIANAKAVAASPLTGGQPFVAINTISAGLSIASSIAAGVKAISQIRQSDTSESAPSGTVPRLSASVSAPGVESTNAPTIFGTQGFNPQNQVAATIQNATQRPVRAYVVSQDISSNQALDRRTNTAATFG
jgi:chromosome segregation ATPase